MSKIIDESKPLVINFFGAGFKKRFKAAMLLLFKGGFQLTGYTYGGQE